MSRPICLNLIIKRIVMAQGKDFQKMKFKLRKNLHILMSILKSFHAAAYHVLWLKFLQVTLMPVDLLFYGIEKAFLKQKKVFKADQIPIIFVVGIQRTGSTLVSQVIEQAFPFAPLGNFCTIFKRSEYLAHKIFKGLYKKKKKPDFKNFYGISKGSFTIGDSYEVWDKWLRNNHYVIPEHISEKQRQKIKKYFINLYHAYRRPILTKNNRNSLMIDIFHDIFPNAYFIVVNRDPVKVIRSTLRASKDYFGKGGHLWGLVPDDHFKVNAYENITEAAAVQYIKLDKLLKEQLKRIPDDRYITIDYAVFCDQPKTAQQKIFEALHNKYNIEKNNVNFITIPFKRSKRLDNRKNDDTIKQYLTKHGYK